ncbi:hypothetical protein H9Y04_08775 [Streptomyces sp. TRM66268-LWL]|uniref:Secreted protein n=1 Tax=Streptomyces polyasparticus TaxID=2767826 RepID=A0ABR7SCF9_9ACTN|nr:hypothetical protein [Streptomyces polyasparticus]MBC9712667.1 hypothetical protein [Streptomyces polyasparticus]
MVMRVILVVVAVGVGVAWTVLAHEWRAKDCRLGQGYALVLTKVGGPDDHEGCRQGLERPEFTDVYVG